MRMCHVSAHACVRECTCEHELGEVVNVAECKGCSCPVREGGRKGEGLGREHVQV